MRSAIVPPPKTIGAPPKPKNVSVCLANEADSPTSHEKPENDELAHVGCNCCGDRENDEEEIAAVIQWQAPVHLRKWCDDWIVSVCFCRGFIAKVLLRGPNANYEHISIMFQISL